MVKNMEKHTVRRIAALVAALVGGYLLYLGANTASSPATAFWSLIGWSCAVRHHALRLTARLSARRG